MAKIVTPLVSICPSVGRRQSSQPYTQFRTGASFRLPGGYMTIGSFSAQAGGVFDELQPREPFGFVAQNQTSKNVWAAFRVAQRLADGLANIRIDQPPREPVEPGVSSLYKQCRQAMLDAGPYWTAVERGKSGEIGR